ncbi:MAG: prenyltransferase/squalene oxidase repeat-containing protein [Gemmataceae bacterium]
MKWSIPALAAVGVFLVQPLGRARADEIPAKYLPTITKGLDYLVSKQFKDGHWGANGDTYPSSMTGLAGVALLMEGSTVREGKYSKNIRLAVDWCMSRAQKGGARDGLIGNPDHPTETGRYMYGHGFATLFLALAYGEEDDKERRAQMKDVLTRAVKYIGNAQSTQGGWFYTSAKDGHDQDEGSVTVTQMQALRACRNAGIPVPKTFVTKGADYLRKSTTANGGVIYSLGRGGIGAPIGGERPALTAAAIACLFSAGEYSNKYVKDWFKYTKRAVLDHGSGRIGHDEYTHYYLCQAVYVLGDDGWEKMFGATPAKERVTWSKYREDMFDHLVKSQNTDGSWPGGGGFSVGPVDSTAIYTTMMQLDRGAVPFYAQ